VLLPLVPIPNKIVQPVTQGEEFTVTWDPETHPTDGVTVSLVLCHGPPTNCVQESTAIASGIPAAQKSYNWSVPCTLAPGTQSTDTGYGMLIIVDGTGEFQCTSECTLLIVFAYAKLTCGAPDSTQFSVLAGKGCSGSSSSSSGGSSTITSGGSIIILPPTQQTGSWSQSGPVPANATGIYTETGTAPWGGATNTAPAGYSFGGSGATWTSSVVYGTTGLNTATTAYGGTTVAGATGSASAPAASASTFQGGAEQMRLNAAGAVIAGALAMFVL